MLDMKLQSIEFFHWLQANSCEGLCEQNQSATTSDTTL